MARRQLSSVDLVKASLDRMSRAYSRRPTIDVRPGVVAFLQPLSAKGTPGELYPRWKSERLKFATFAFGGAEYKVVQFCGGKWEIYRCEAGMETFLGYDFEVLPSLLRGAVCSLGYFPEASP